LPPGASGSRITITSSRVPFGIPDQRSGNGLSAPSHVYARGIGAPAANAALETWIWDSDGGDPELVDCDDDEEEAELVDCDDDEEDAAIVDWEDPVPVDCEDDDDAPPPHAATTSTHAPPASSAGAGFMPAAGLACAPRRPRPTGAC
jgi:hypothetical protein